MKGLLITTNDIVIVCSGNDKGKTGKVIQTFPRLGKVVVDGVHIITKHMRPKNKNEKGQRIQLPGPINISNVALLCEKCKKGSRIKIKRVNGIYTRHCHRCDTEFVKVK